jgi:hypothetical protein
MKIKKQPRRLVIFNINDRRGQLVLEKGQNFLTVKEVNSYIAAQKLLITSDQSGGGRGGDLFLIDVDFGESDYPKDLEWGVPEDIAPFGPLLALPFLSKEVCVFVPYSNYWGVKGVKMNGFVRVAMSLLLAATKREYFTLDEVGEVLESGTEGDLSQSAKLALEKALKLFRKTLEHSDHIQLLDIEKTYNRLVDLEQAAFDQGASIAVPFCDAEGTLSVNFSYPPYHFDSIELSSLFADVLDFWPPADQGALTDIFAVLERWKRLSIETDGDTLANTVRSVLEECERFPLPKAIGQVLPAGSSLSEFAVKRIAMEFAWVQAWYQELTSYAGEDDAERPSLIKRVHTILGLSELNNPAIKYRRLLADTSGDTNTVSEEPWRTKFKLVYSNTNDAYQLDANEPSAISPLERAMCIQYAQDVLDWDGSNPQYPRWMTE